MEKKYRILGSRGFTTTIVQKIPLEYGDGELLTLHANIGQKYQSKSSLLENGASSEKT